VLECWDRHEREYVAVKVVRTHPKDKYSHAARLEIEVLETLRRLDPGAVHHCVRLRRHFMHRGHVCMAFDRLGSSLYDFLRRNSYHPFRVDLVADFGRQLLDAMQFMHAQGLVHTDLKPENILLHDSSYDKQPTAPGSKVLTRVPHSSAVWLIDFGSATWDERYHSTVVSTRHYRAPEVILGMGWSFPCDVWSLGCILVELLTGEALFQTHENLEHLAMMEAVVGPIPPAVIARSDEHSRKYFRDPPTQLRWPEGSSSRDSVRAVRKLRSLGEIVRQAGVPPGLASSLTDLLASMLRYDPGRRITAAQALRHAFFNNVAIKPPAPPVRPPPPPVAMQPSYPTRGCGPSSTDRLDLSRTTPRIV